MNFKLLNVVFRIGKLLAMTPEKVDINKVKSPSMLHAFFVIAIYTIGICVSGFYRYPDYRQMSSVRLLVQILLDTFLYVLNVCMVVLSIRKQSQWSRMFKNLEITKLRSGEDLGYARFIIGNVVYLALEIYETCVYVNILDMDFFRQYAIEYLQLYSQFLVYFLLYVLLKMILIRYQVITKTLLEHLKKRLSRPDFFSYMKKIKYDVCILGEAVDNFNNIFGWPFLLIISFTSLQTLMSLQNIFVLSKSTFGTIFFSVVFIVWDFVGTFSNIFLCDSIRHEAEKILSVAYRIETDLLDEKSREVDEIRMFIDVVSDNLPHFSAARFFDIDRTTVFRIFNAIVTFLIVMIQFESSRGMINGGSVDSQQCNCSNTQ